MEISKKQTVEQFKISEKIDDYEAIVFLIINKDEKTFTIEPKSNPTFMFQNGTKIKIEHWWWAVLRCIDKAINIANKELYEEIN